MKVSLILFVVLNMLGWVAGCDSTSGQPGDGADLAADAASDDSMNRDVPESSTDDSMGRDVPESSTLYMFVTHDSFPGDLARGAEALSGVELADARCDEGVAEITERGDGRLHLLQPGEAVLLSETDAVRGRPFRGG